MNTFTPGSTVTLNLTLSDGAVGLYPTARVFNGATLVTTVNLADLGNGRYAGAWVPASAVAYAVLFTVYADAGHTSISAYYGRGQETWEPNTSTPDLALVRKLMTNRLELSDGFTGNWKLYDDDDVTVLRTWDVTDKTGGTIVQPGNAPSRRSKGV